MRFTFLHAFVHSLSSGSVQFAVKSSFVVHVLVVLNAFLLAEPCNLTSLEDLHEHLLLQPFRLIPEVLMY